MKLRSSFTTVAITFVLALTVAGAAFAQKHAPFGDADKVAPAQILARCSTPDLPKSHMDAIEMSLRRYVDELGVQATGSIKIAWHVIYSGAEGNIPQSQIDAQIAYMNSRYAGTGFTFSLASVDRTDNRRWFGMTPGTGKESQAKNALALDVLHRFNVYTCKPGQNLLGWATFPNSYAEDNKLHGVVIHYGSVPGGYLAPYDLGGTLAHEAGHYLGLYHTFQGGCVAPGDQCDDTPFEASPASGCPDGRDTCTQPGLDPIHNYMDYSDDACYNNFTANQIARMQAQTGLYRPNLLNAALALASMVPVSEEISVSGGVMLRSAFPNPFKGSTTLRLSLARNGHVSVKVYNVAGQAVETLWDGEMQAGERQLTFASKRLPAGTYFVQAAMAGSRSARTVVLIQ
ncbi:MAG: M43 family zinc metalloprotease [Candidatus Eisenbacteria bacterium]